MTTDLEKQFFDTFGIEPRYEDACTVEDKYWNNEELANEYGTFDHYMNCKCGNQENCTTECSCAYQREVYPQLTDRILLKLRGLSNHKTYEEYKAEELKKVISIMSDNPYKKSQIRTLFEEG
jgi:hypothetical protein